ncbi:unnamed protein product [Polarella glacialis]|uniref:Uncharacterized protein n=1 Tax=Polarella glacialis TaxID=89957 RepID=A0A813FPZ9_POLGL|nr:unnamed protein product [Polarella glacialis]
MEVLVTDCIGVPADAIVSVRFGPTRRQAPLAAVCANSLKFPSHPEAICEPLKIEVLQPIASARLVLHPNKDAYRISFLGNSDLAMSLTVKSLKDLKDGVGIKTEQVGDRESRLAAMLPQKSFQDAASSARDYLEGHGLLKYVQALLHAIIQTRPKDPKDDR